MSPKSDSRTWNTSITSIEPNHIRYRGYAVEDLMGRIGYPSVLHLLLTGELPNSKVARLLDSILVSSMDHGVTPPSTLAARTAASTGAPLNAALAAGLLSINRYHGGAIEACMGHLDEVAGLEVDGKDRDVSAREIVRRNNERGVRLSGFGHRVHTRDPRARRLFEIANEEGMAGPWVSRVQALESALRESTGRELPINVDGAIAALLKEMHIAPELANALFMVARMPGLLAQVAEERAGERPMRKIMPGSERYVGPEPRTPGEDESGREDNDR